MIDQLTTSLFDLEKLTDVIRKVAEDEVMVRITLPRSWCRIMANVPMLSPKALRYVDLKDAPDDHFPAKNVFVLEVGKQTFGWKKPVQLSLHDDD